MVPRTSVTRTFGAISASISSEPSLTLVTSADDAAAGDDAIAALDPRQHLALCAHLGFCCGPNQQEVEDDEDKDEREKLDEEIAAAATRTLCPCLGNEHVLPPPQVFPAVEKSARTIAVSPPLCNASAIWSPPFSAAGNDGSRSAKALISRIAEALERLAPPSAPQRRHQRSRSLRLARCRPRASRPCRRSTACSIDLLVGIDRQKEILLENTHAASPRRLHREQRHAVGRARHGQVVAGQGRTCRRERRNPGQPGTHRDPARGHPHPARPAGPAARPATPLPGVLRRPVLRARGRRLQGAEIGAGWRHRGPARERAVLRHLEPPPPDVHAT
jgi:hypothetical protein